MAGGEGAGAVPAGEDVEGCEEEDEGEEEEEEEVGWGVRGGGG